MGFGGRRARAAPHISKTIVNKSQTEDFFLSFNDEPHIARRRQILDKHPDIEKLFGSDSRPAPFVLFLIISQIYLSYCQREWSWQMFFLVAWTYGGAASHALSLMTHELSHSLLFKDTKANEYFGIVCNIGMGIPSSTMFKRYHMEHHQYQGDLEKDVDVPCHWEGIFFSNSFLKAFWLLCQPLFYALRPCFVRPKSMRTLDKLNAIVIFISDALLFYFFGPRAVLYLVTSTLLGMGFHPVAGHFISEHFVFVEGHETYSYYGPLNLISWNVGYHNEHHDFPRIPGWKLPLVKALAPEFYDHLPQHKSWTFVLWSWIASPFMGPFNRVLRNKILNQSQGQNGSPKSHFREKSD